MENSIITSNCSDHAEIRCFVRCSSFYEVNVCLPGRIRVISSAKSSWPLQSHNYQDIEAVIMELQ